MRYLIILLSTFLLIGCSEKATDNSMNNEGEQSSESVEVAEVEKVVLEEVKTEEVKFGTLTFIGRASVRIELLNGLVIYIDPAEGDKEQYDMPADIVLVTHQHSDHNKYYLVDLKDDGEKIICPNDITEGDVVESHGVEIEAVAAYNTNHKRDASCGFILRIDGFTLYHSGDTSLVEEMYEIKESIDYALITMDGYWNMGPVEAKQVADILEPKWAVPIHSDSSGLFNQSNVDDFLYENKIILEPNMSTTLYVTREISD